MFAADLFSALVPVLPFGLLPIALGIGRAKVGRRRRLPTTLRTLCIAAAAGIAGAAVGALFS